MMSLLDVYIILAYYCDAEKNARYTNKITNQIFDNQYVLSKIQEISTYHSSALHWNLRELNESLPILIQKVKHSYAQISKKTNVKMHNEKGIDDFAKVLADNIKEFMDFSRAKAQKAQSREFSTIQPKEKLENLAKAKIVIKNYLGGQYFLTVHEVK